MQTGSGIGSPGGKGARGIFNIGKAQVLKMDKNSKNNVTAYFVGFIHLMGLAFYQYHHLNFVHT